MRGVEALMSVDDAVIRDGAPGPETELVRRARQGDRGARDELVIRHRRQVYFLALQLLGNQDDALDVSQDAMLRFFANLHRFDAERPVRPWLFRIVRNLALDLFRRRKVRQTESLDAVGDEDGERTRIDPADPSVDLDRDLLQSQLRRRLFAALNQLTPMQREIVVLRDYQDLSYQEIAEMLEIPLGTVMSRLHGARQRLRLLVEGDLKALAG
jgi:RNA polymerase sigma-70 factor (ECF subfamily)